jgi:O-antigen ligase
LAILSLVPTIRAARPAGLDLVPDRLSSAATRALAGLGALAVLLVITFAIVQIPDAPSTRIVLAVGVAMLGTVALALARFDAAVALGLCLLPIVKFEPAPSDALFGLLLPLALVTGRLRLRRVPLIVSSAVGLLIALNVLSLTDAVDMPAAARFLAITVYLGLFALWLATYIDSERKARTLVVIYLGGAVLSALVGSAALNLPMPGRDLFIGDGASRASALFKDPNVFGPFLVPIAAIVLEERFRRRLLRLRSLTSWLVLGILAMGVLFSYSRAGWANFALSIAVTVTIIALRRGGGRRAFRAIAGLLVALAITGAVIGASGSVAFLQERAQLQGYDSERFGAQRAGAQLAQRYPTGVGPGQFRFHHPVETHSTYVRVLVEQGYLGLAVWTVLIVATLVLALRNAVLGRDTWGIGSAALLGAWCGLLLNSVVVDTLHWRHLWLVAALIWAGAMRRAQSNVPAGSAARDFAPT